MTPASDDPNAERKAWMRVLARASAGDMRALLADCPALPPHIRLRGPEVGLVMARGRIGGGGGAFNLGEIAVTRCTVRSEAGQVGHATIARRDDEAAELAARIDAALQDPARHDAMAARVITPLAAAQEKRRQDAARRAAATQVQFFTMATMRS